MLKQAYFLSQLIQFIPVEFRLIDLTHSLCPLKVFLLNPVFTSHILMLLSLEAEMRKSPLGVNSIEEIVCSCPEKVLTQERLSKFHIFMVKSDEHEASNLPLLSNDRQLIAAVCPLICFSFVKSSHSQVIIEASSEPLTSIL